MRARSVFGIVLSIIWPVILAGAQTVAPVGEVPVDPGLGMQSIVLWPNGAPDEHGKQLSDIPGLTIFTPLHGNGTAVIVDPGGGYVALVATMEGREIADWFAARGVTAFVLRYRLGSKYLYPIPLNDAMRAVRYVRFNAAKYKVDPNRIGMIGFSAGGHLTAMVGTMGGPGDPAAIDPIDRVSSKLDFMVLGYPWLNAMLPNSQSLITYCSTRAKVKGVPPADCKVFETKYTPLNYVTHDTPPTFMYITSNDNIVDVNAAVAFYQAERAAHVPVEFHSFEDGKHGTGLGSGDPSLDMWPTLLENWMRAHGLLPRE